MSRVVRPETHKIDISGGDWLLIKKRLNHGESRQEYARRYIAGADGVLQVNPLRVESSKITAYLLDWSLMGPDDAPLIIRGQPIEVVEAMLDSLDQDSFNEIYSAILAHERAMQKTRETEKKTTPTGERGSSAISSSASGSAGATSGLPN